MGCGSGCSLVVESGVNGGGGGSRMRVVMAVLVVVME